jgi:4-amino-4-deoxy-L-arabinose transferase-like glycosyltransferase
MSEPEVRARGRWLAWAIDHGIGAALCVGYVAVLLATAPDLGLARDEGIYVQTAEVYGRWLELLWREPGAALQPAAIDQAFRVNREHPPLMKLLSGLGALAQRELGLFAYDSNAFRFPGMLSAGLLLWLIHVFGARLYGRTAGLFAALAFALLPRPFYHAHLNAFDVPITLAVTAVTYAYWRSLASGASTRARVSWALVCGALFGLALLTKHNSWLLPGVFAIHFGLTQLIEWRVQRSGAARRASRVPFALLAMFVLGPAIFFAGWPFLWHDTWLRLDWYAAFHLKHEYYNMEYFGVNYFWPPFPMSYAWVMTYFTVPLTTLALGLAGLAQALRVLASDQLALWRRSADAAGSDVVPPDPAQTTLLLIGAMFAPLVLISLPSTPIFGGTKHWFPAYPILALFAGRAFCSLVAPASAWLAGGGLSRLLSPGARTRVVSLVLGGALLAPALVETVHSHPFGLSHYTVAAGGVPGAAEYGMNRQFWGFTTRSLAPYLREAMPRGGSVYICDTIHAAFMMLIRDGHLPANIRATGDIALANYALVHHEKHFAEVDHQIWTTYGSVQPVRVLTYDGVPIISVYENPRR